MPLANRLPQTTTGCILITTRDKRVRERLANREKSIVILPMTDSEEEKLLSSKQTLECGDLDKGIVNELLEALRHLPLAISQAAAYISENSITIDDFLEAFHAEDSEVQDLLSGDLPDLRRDFEDPNSVIRTWKVTFDQIRKQKPQAAEMLSLMTV